jgi:PAS domain S-box-containing protein
VLVSGRIQAVTATPPGFAQAILRAANQAGIGVSLTLEDETGVRPIYVNSALGELFGLTPEQIGDPGCLPGGGTQGFRPGHRAAVAETEIQQVDGSQVPVRLAKARAGSELPETWVTLYFPLAHRQYAERALISSEQRFLRLIEAAPDTIIIVQANDVGRLRFVYANRAVLRDCGYSSLEEYLALPASRHVHPDDCRRVETAIRALLASHQATCGMEVRLQCRDGSFVSMDTVCMPTDWDGVPSVLAIARNLSDRRRLQAQLVQADRLAAAGTLAAGVAHEINNPLAYVLLNLQYLIRELPRVGDDPRRLDQLSGRLREAHHGAQRVSTIVRDLRDFSAQEQQQLGPVNLRRVVEAALKVAGSQLEGRARVIEEYEVVPPVQGNAARLEQVFLNLLVNAAQALSPERADRNEIRVSLRVRGSEVLAEIADNGAGISFELLDRVFDPFFTTKPAGVGTGLGLPICHSIVSSLGGEITAESQIGQGTVFRITLPTCARMIPARSATPFPFAAPVMPRVRVLVVDDELPVASMLSKLLADEHEVRITTCGREALELLQTDPFDVVLCDLLMPGMSGMDLENRIVFMTGGAFTPRAGEFLATVGNPRIEKPFDLNEVRRLVRKMGARVRG